MASKYNLSAGLVFPMIGISSIIEKTGIDSGVSGRRFASRVELEKKDCFLKYILTCLILQ